MVQAWPGGGANVPDGGGMEHAMTVNTTNNTNGNTVELTRYDGQVVTLLDGQQAPELIERQRPNDSRARGGARSDPLLDMGLLLVMPDS